MLHILADDFGSLKIKLGIDLSFGASATAQQLHSKPRMQCIGAGRRLLPSDGWHNAGLLQRRFGDKFISSPGVSGDDVALNK